MFACVFGGSNCELMGQTDPGNPTAAKQAALAGTRLARDSKVLFKSDISKAKSGDKAEGFKVAPVIAEKDGVKYLKGPCELVVNPEGGIVKISFSFLGFESGQQQEMIFINSDSEKPFTVIKNVNSSGRIEGKAVISEKNQYKPDFWHKIQIQLNTRRGNIKISTDGKSRYDDKTAVENAKFAGLKFASLANIKDLSIEVAALPPVTEAEIKLRGEKTELEKKVNALKENSDSEIRQKAILAYQLELLTKAIGQDAIDIGNDIASDIRYGLTKDIGRKDENQVWLRPVVQLDKNPYLDKEMNEKWYAEFISKPDYGWKLPSKESNSYDNINGIHGSRVQAINANEWMLLYSHPQSPLKDRTELLVRAMRRIDAYMRGYHYHENMRTNSFLNDFFALGPALIGAVMIDKNFPEILLPKQKELWMAAAKKAAERYSQMNFTGNYSNADLGASRIFINSALFSGEKKDLEQGLKLAYSWAGNIYEDGGSAYIAKQNESPSYSFGCIELEFDNYLMTHDPKLLEILKSVEYYPISITDSNLTTEWYTPPSWKQSWYNAGLIVNPVSYYLTGNQYYKTISGNDYFELPKEPSIKKAMIYRTYPYVAKKMPNNYTVYDRNIQGVRMNYGLYSAAMNGRITDQLLGKNSFVGLTIAEIPREDKRAFSAALYGLNAFPVISGKPGHNTVTKENISVALGRDFASLNADYSLAQAKPGPARVECNWKGRQSWIYLPDRMIGLVELTPDGSQKATAITLNLELGRTKSGAFDTSPLEKINEKEFKYGKLLIVVHDTNFKGSKISDKPDNMSSDGNRGPHSELHFVDAANLKEWSSEQRNYEGTYYAVIELRMADSKQNAKVAKIVKDGLIGLTAEVSGKSYSTIYNYGDSVAKIPSANFAKNGRTSLFADRTSFAAPVQVPAEIVIPAKQSVLIVSGEDERMHKPGIVGWKPFIEYFEKNRQEFEKPPSP